LPGTLVAFRRSRRTAWAVSETSPPFQRLDQGPRAVGVAKRRHEHGRSATGGRLPAGRRCGKFQGRRRSGAEFTQLPADVRFKLDLPAVTADERRLVLNQCRRVAPPVFACYAAWVDLAPTEIALRE